MFVVQKEVRYWAGSEISYVLPYLFETHVEAVEWCEQHAEFFAHEMFITSNDSERITYTIFEVVNGNQASVGNAEQPNV